MMILQMIFFILLFGGCTGRRVREVLMFSGTTGHATHAQAKQICAHLNMSLPQLSKDEDQRKLVKLARRLNIKNAWLPWEFVYFGSWIWIDGTKYGGKVPMRESASRICAAYRKYEGMAYAADCFVEAHGFICQYSDCKKCSGEGCVQQPGNESACFKVTNFLSTWQYAASTCAQEGSTLLLEMRHISFLEARLKGRDHWIGLIKAGWQAEEKHGRTNLGLFPISPWRKGTSFDKRKRCSIIQIQQNSGVWVPVSCNSTEYFICGKEGNHWESTKTHHGKRDKTVIVSLSVVLSVIFFVLCLVFAMKITKQSVIRRFLNYHTTRASSPDPVRPMEKRRSLPKIPEYANDDLSEDSFTSQLPPDYECVAYKNIELQMHGKAVSDKQYQHADYEMNVISDMP